MNKGFILDGFPRTKDDAELVFMNYVAVKKEGDPSEEEPQMKKVINDKIIPQYCISLEADDAFLMQKSKEIPPDKVEGTHFNEAGMVRRCKEYRTRNQEDSGNTVKDFMTEVIGYPNVLIVDATLANKEQLLKMQEIIEQKGKPCCINMITDEDKKFLVNLQKTAEKAAKKKAKADAAAAGEAEASVEDAHGVAHRDSDDEVDEITLII
jgi:adenylate kinase